MKHAGLLAATLLAAACGGASPPAPPTPDTTGDTAGAGGTAVELWAPVMQPGAVFTFVEQRDEDGPPSEEEPVTVQATVTEVKDVDGARAAILAWTAYDEPLSTSNMPQVIVVGAAGVTFYSNPDDFAAGEPALTFPPAAVPAKLAGGDYIDPGTSGLAGELCYGYGPADDAEDCEDVCFSQLCVHPTHGLTGGEGKWWPNDFVYGRADLAR